MKTYTLYLFRHGITKGNINAQYIGHTDYPLTTDGIESLKKIKGKYHYPEVDAVFVSPLKRALQSADIMFPKNNKIVIDNFIEYNFGEFEECTAEDLKDNEDFKNWLHGDIYSAPPYGESNAEFAQRICDSFGKWTQDTDTKSELRRRFGCRQIRWRLSTPLRNPSRI